MFILSTFNSNLLFVKEVQINSDTSSQVYYPPPPRSYITNYTGVPCSFIAPNS